MSPSSFPPAVPCADAPFPPQGPVGSVPLLPRYYEAFRLPDDPPARLRCLRRRGTTATRLSLPWRSGAHPPRARVVHRLPQPATRRGVVRASQVPGEPSCGRALLSDPGETPSTLPVTALGCCLPLLVRRRLSRRFNSFGAQSHGPPTRCLRFAARVSPAPRKTRFRLVASFAGRGLNPQGPFVRFPLSTLLPPRPGFSWRTRVL